MFVLNAYMNKLISMANKSLIIKWIKENKTDVRIKFQKILS